MKSSFFFLLIPSLLMAAQQPPEVPSAGIVERQLEQEYNAQPLDRDRVVPQLEIDIPEERLTMSKGAKIEIKKIVIESSSGKVPVKNIEKEMNADLPKEMNLGDIYSVCHEIEKKYAEQGYFLARAYPPPQNVEGGSLTIIVLEGEIGSIEIEGAKYYKPKFIEKYFSRLRGNPLQYDELMRALLLVNENMDLKVGAVFKKGEKTGTADLILRVEDKRPLHLYANLNNYGKDLTTKYRAGGRFDFGNIFTNGDQLSIAEVVGFPVNALYFTDVKYKVPLTHTGAFLEVAYLFSKFHVEELTELKMKGRSNIGTIKGSYAALRKRWVSLDVFSYFDIKDFQNYALGQKTSNDQLRVLTAGFSFDQYDPTGRNYLVFKTGVGIPSFLGGMGVVDHESSRPGAGGRFIKFNLDYDRIQHVYKTAMVTLHASGQWSPNPLTIPEQIYIGGADTVRGFPLAVATGDSGYYANLELHFAPPGIAKLKSFIVKKTWEEILQIVGFFDCGGVFFQSFENTFLFGSGIGFRLQGPWNLALSVDVGWPLNHRDLSHSAFTYVKLTGQFF